MKKIEWKVALDEKGGIAILEAVEGLPQDKLESHLTIIGILEDIKQKHLNKIETQVDKTIRRGGDGKSNPYDL